MNNFEIKFFNKYLNDGEEIKGVVHKHFTEVLGILIFWLSLAFIPSFMYFYSFRIQSSIPFYFLEMFLVLIYVKVIYDIFDWYNDVWIITNTGIIDLRWSLLKKNINNVNFGNIEGLEVDQNGLMDSILKRGSLVVHKIGDDSFILENTYKPFLKVNLIEEIKAESDEEEDEVSVTERRFDKIINTLGGMMEGYFENNFTKNQDIDDEIEKIEEVRDNKGTIDLR